MAGHVPGGERSGAINQGHACGLLSDADHSPLGHIRLDRLTVADVNRLMPAMRDAGKADSTRRNCYTTLRIALDDAVLSGLLATNPAHKVSKPRTRRQKARFLTADETGQLMTGATGLRYANRAALHPWYRSPPRRGSGPSLGGREPATG